VERRTAAATRLPWALAAAVVGLLAALAAQEGARSAAATVVAVAVLVIALVLVLPHPERGVLLMLLVLPLDVAGRLLTEPLSITVFHVSLLLTLVAWAIAWLRDPETSAPRLSALDVGIAALVRGRVVSARLARQGGHCGLHRSAGVPVLVHCRSCFRT